MLVDMIVETWKTTNRKKIFFFERSLKKKSKKRVVPREIVLLIFCSVVGTATRFVKLMPLASSLF